VIASKYLNRTRRAGLTWPPLPELDYRTASSRRKPRRPRDEAKVEAGLRGLPE
jgi:hypothetical protein